MALGDFFKKDLIIPNADSPVSQIPGLPFIPLLLERGDPVWFPSVLSGGSVHSRATVRSGCLGPPEAVKTQSTAQQKHCRLLSTVSSSISSFFYRRVPFFSMIYTYFYLELHQSSLFWYAFSCYENRNSFSLVFIKIWLNWAHSATSGLYKKAS